MSIETDISEAAIKSYVADMQLQLAEMLEDINDPLASEARKLAFSLASPCGDDEHSPRV